MRGKSDIWPAADGPETGGRTESVCLSVCSVVQEKQQTQILNSELLFSFFFLLKNNLINHEAGKMLKNSDKCP